MAAALLACLCLMSVDSAVAQEKAPLGPDQWPTSLRDAVRDIVGHLSDKDKEIVRTTKREDLIQFHHGWGTGIRSHYGSGGATRSCLFRRAVAPAPPDDASF
jgi:hypothetical protein